MKGRKEKMNSKTIFKILVPLLEAIVFVSCGFAFSTANVVQKSTELSLFANECKQNGAKYCYANIDIVGEKKNNLPETIFSNTYSENFSGTSTKLMAISDNSNVASFDTFFNGDKIPFSTCVVSGKNYTNDPELLRLETVCINIYKYRPRQEEHYYDGSYDGFIYIPDYYADYIIDNFCPDYTYDDFLTNDSLNSISLGNNTNSFKYKIANIFHVNGFNKNHMTKEQFAYNDLNTGEILDLFFNGFCFVSNYGHFSDLNKELHTTVFCELQPKRYMLDETLMMANNYKNAFKANEIKVAIYYSSEGGTKKVSNSDNISNIFFAAKENYGLVVLGIAFCFLDCSVFAVYAYICKKDLFEASSFIPLISMPIVLLIVSFIFRSLLPTKSIYSFFNPLIMVATAIYLAVVLITFAILVIKKKGDSAE